ncbi:MAG: TolC family protein [Candidatus Omnitrophota bacterium]
MRFGLILFLIFGFILQIAPVYPLDTAQLGTLIEEAKQNNPAIKASKKRWEAAQARVPQAKSLDNPTIGFTFEKIPRGTIRIDRTMTEDRMLSITQMLPFFGKLPLKGKIALVESQMLAADYKDKELEVVNAVKLAYYDLFMNYKEIELDEESLLFLENIANIAEAKYIVGDAMQEELFKLNLEIASLSTDIANLKQGLLAKETRLNTILNRQAEAVLGMPQLTQEVSFRANIEDLYKLTLENQPTLLVFSYAIERNKHAKALAKKSILPDLMAGIVLRGLGTGSFGAWDLMLAFSVPLWFWSKQRYEIKESIANLEEAEAAYQVMKNKAFSETKELFTRIEIAKNKVSLYKSTQIPLLEGSIQASLSAYQSGNGDIMMLLDSQRMFIETKMNYYKALVEYNMNLADLERTVGGNLK